MNKLDLLRTIEKRTAKAPIRSVTLVGVMVLLVPILSNVVEARTIGKAVALDHYANFKNVKWTLESGKFNLPSQVHFNSIR
jgi:hypothetical protein